MAQRPARRRQSAGLLMYRRGPRGIEVFLVHPGGPFFAGKDEGAWSIPKGEIEPGERALEVARREFLEETGADPASLKRAGPWIALGAVTQKGGKRVQAWAFEGDWPEGRPIRSQTFTMEWPPGSGKKSSFPEVDRAAFFTLDEARRKLNPAQVAFLDRLEAGLGHASSTDVP